MNPIFPTAVQRQRLNEIADAWIDEALKASPGDPAKASDALDMAEKAMQLAALPPGVVQP